jgi:GNAT superfamily N-acetyltransferase
LADREYAIRGADPWAPVELMGDRITLRPAREDDEAFLRRVYAGTREEELALVPWDDAQKRAFLDMQFNAQHRFYHDQFPEAAFQVILLHGEPVGRLYVDRRAGEIHVIDIALVPGRRNAGIGGALLRSLLAEAAEACKPVRIHVERFNRAMSLYLRLGFTPIEDQGVYFLMEWSPRGKDGWQSTPSAGDDTSPSSSL